MHEKINKFFRILKETKEPSYDVETNGLKWQTCHVVGYSVSDGVDSVYIPVRHEGGANIDDPDTFEEALNKEIEKHPGKLITWNGKFDSHFSQNHGVNLNNKIIDGMVMECLLDENKRSYALKNCLKEDGIEHKHDTALYQYIGAKFDIKPDRSSMGHYYRLAGDDHLAVEYAKDDTRVTKLKYEKQKQKLYAENLDVISNLENDLTYVLQKMERRGIRVCPEETKKVKEEVDRLYEEAYLKIPLEETEDGNIKFINIRSGKDLKEYFEWCEIDDWPMTAPTERFPDGQASFTKEYLATTPQGLNILNARKLGHLKASFIDVLDNHIYNSKIHTTFNQTRGETHGTKTGRLSSSTPNMQQVPKRDEELGRIYRRMFVPQDGYILIEYDYSQAEPRLYAHYSGEPTLLEGYQATPYVDMHSIAANYMNVSRKVAKNLNLGIMYTMGAEKLARQLGISLQESYDILRRWKRTFPNVSKFTKRASQVAEERTYVKTILGRRARFPDPRWSYRAANRIIQGGSADILKWKMVEIDNYLVKNNLEDVCRMLLTIHDSLVFEIRKDCLHLIPVIAGIMERVNGAPFNLKIPFIADHKWGDNWAIATYGEAQ